MKFDDVEIYKKLVELKEEAMDIMGDEYHLVLSNLILSMFRGQDKITVDEVLNLIQEQIDVAKKANAKNDVA